ncbi:hypothetical protein PENTCL1PPCAC_6108, partial [Pristionchus entomophagus]
TSIYRWSHSSLSLWEQSFLTPRPAPMKCPQTCAIACSSASRKTRWSTPLTMFQACISKYLDKAYEVDGRKVPYYLHYVEPKANEEVLFVLNIGAHKNITAHDVYIDGVKYDRSEGLQSYTEEDVTSGKETSTMSRLVYGPSCIAQCLNKDYAYEETSECKEQGGIYGYKV